MKRLFVIVSVILLLFALTSCFKQEFDSGAIVLRGAKDLNFSVGETKTVIAELPQIEGLKLTAICEDPALDTQISDDNALTLSCNTAGDYILTLQLAAKDYRSMQRQYSVSVTTPPMSIAAVLADGNALDLGNVLTLSTGAEKTLVLSGAPDNAVYRVQNSDSAVATVEQQSNAIILAAAAPGKTRIQIDVICVGYQPYSTELCVEVDKPAALLNLANDIVSGTTQDTLRVTCAAFQPGGRLTASANDPAVSIQVNGNIILISSTKPGDFTVTVSCVAEGYRTTAKTTRAVFSRPAVPLSLPESISVALKQAKDIPVSELPDGAALSLSIDNNNIDVEYKNGILMVEGKSVGNTNITIIASCTGYADSRVTLPVVVGGVTYNANSQYDQYVKEIIDLINEERAYQGLSELTYLPELQGACQTRAEEASTVWDHIRPDGRGWETVLTDMGYSYYAAGENLLDGNVLDAASAVEAWMDSPGHRKNILRSMFTGVCVGIVQGANGNYYYAQLFITKE
ncbi:MAG: CAP domain-containing protein [Candidatus Fimivivens sp.]